ncbi:PH-like domain-containing protein [Bounagaea algeriensis]
MSRALWVLALTALAVLCVYGMRRGWRNRARRQAALPELPQPPAELGGELVAALSGLYVGTVRAGDWQDRIAASGLGSRASATARLYAAGMLIEREGADDVWIPAEAIARARVDHKLANKVVPRIGLVVVTWRLGEHELDTGVRGTDQEEHRRWAEAVETFAHPVQQRDEQTDEQMGEQTANGRADGPRQRGEGA